MYNTRLLCVLTNGADVWPCLEVAMSSALTQVTKAWKEVEAIMQLD